MPIILRRHCIFCDSSTHIDGPCRNCGILKEDALRELVDASLIIEDDEEDYDDIVFT